jgi:spermidine synthase
LADGRLVPVCDDAWHYLQATGERYDLVVNDAFSRNKPLGPMATATGARIIHGRLAEGGLYLANVIAPLEGAKAQVLHDTLAVFADEFAHVYVIPERPEEPNRPACNVMVASDRTLDLTGIDGAREA